MTKKQSKKYNAFKGKILSSVFKNASTHEKRFSNKALNNFTVRAMRSSHKSNKLQIRQIEYEHAQQNAQLASGEKPMQMFWITKARLKILKRVNASKRIFARRKSKRRKK